MRRTSPALALRVVATSAWLLAGALARPGAAQAPRPTAAAPSFADLLTDEETVQPTWAAPSSHARGAPTPTAPRVVTGPFDTITESLFGTPDPNTWRSLP